MKTLNKLAIYCIILICISSCLRKDPLVGTWEFTSAQGVSNNSGSEDYGGNSLQSYIIFSGDHTFLFVDKGSFDPLNVTELIRDSLSGKVENARVYSGTWQLKDSVITYEIRNYRMKRDLISKVISNDGRNLSLSFPEQQQPIFKSKEAYKYRKVDYNDVSRSDYPFTSLEMNKWRIKSNKRLSKEEIKAKVENALEFSIAFLEYHETHDKTAMTHFLEPSPFSYYGNGVVLNSHFKNEDWNNLFYDDEDAQVAYNMLEKSFDNVAEIPDKISKNPIKINIFVLEETLKNLKTIE